MDAESGENLGHAEFVLKEKNADSKSEKGRESSPEDGVDSWVDQSNTDLDDTLKKRENS